MVQASLDGVPFRLDPSSVSWSFKIKAADTRAVGGKVIQVFGTTLGDMTVTGQFGRGDWARGDVAGWQEQRRFTDQVDQWATVDDTTHQPKLLRFLFPSRKWDFNVYLKTYSSPSASDAVHLANEEINPQWQLTLFIVEDKSRTVVKGIKDLYIARLAEGVGWKISEYNGNTQSEVDSLLHGRTMGDYIGDLAQAAAEGRQDQSQVPTAGGGGGGSGGGTGGSGGGSGGSPPGGSKP